MRRWLQLGVIIALGSGAIGAASPAQSGRVRWQIHDLVVRGGRDCRAVALNERGHILINCYQGSDRHSAFVWRDGRAIALGTLAGDKNSQAVAINNDGSVVGNSDSGTAMIGVHGDTFERTHAFLWQNGELTALPTPSSRWKWSQATGLNGNHQAIGVYSSQEDPFGSHAILWTHARITNLGARDRIGERSWAAAINDRGDIVGYRQRPYAAGSFAVLWRGRATHKLGPPPTRNATGVTSNALAVSQRGQVLGATGFGGSGGFLWRNGKTIILHGLNVASLNDRGEVAGTGGDFVHDTFHARVWQDGKTTDLGTIAGARQSEAASINNKGQVIGQSGDYVNAKQKEWFHAIVWQNGTLTDLGTLSGGRQSTAVAINNRNEIVGWSSTRNGERHAVLWMPRSR